MAAPHRCAAIAIAVGALITMVPVAAEADTTAPTPSQPAIPPVITCGTPTATTTSGTTSGQAGAESVPCIEAAGNVYIIYVITITTTTTITEVSAPIVAANGAITGPITWVHGIPISAIDGTQPTSSKSGPSDPSKTSNAGWVKCTATTTSTAAKSTLVHCPTMSTGSTAKTRTKHIKLMCEPDPTPASNSTKQPRKRTASKTPRQIVVFCRRI